MNAFPNSVVPVATGVPAFIGYTEKAATANRKLSNVPTRISSLSEYEHHFGKAPQMKFSISATGTGAPGFAASGKSYWLTATTPWHSLYNSLRLFFQNGGGVCYIVSVGDFSNGINAAELTNGLTPLLKEQEPAILVIPEAIRLGFDDCMTLQRAMLDHCNTMQSRFAILDIWNGDKDLSQTPTPVDSFRDGIGVNYLRNGAAYYPWLHTSVVQPAEIDFSWIDSSADGEAGSSTSAGESDDDLLISLLKDEAGSLYTGPKLAAAIEQIDLIRKVQDAGSSSSTGSAPVVVPSKEELNQALLAASPLFCAIMKALLAKLNLAAPSAAMAGIYALVDNQRGVWKAPSNVSLSSVVAPAVNISDVMQEDLNVPLPGLAVNAIRAFAGQGVLVWGARTLDGNSQDWRYISVRRTVIMIGQSVKIAAMAYVLQPNDANTWTAVKSLIDSFLMSQWKEGALVGAMPNEAFDVQVGLGTTMTADDVLNGLMNVTVKVAISRPAEFIVITFQQQQQKG